MQQSFNRELESLDAIHAMTEQYFAERPDYAPLRFAVDFCLEELFTNMVKYNSDGPRQIQLELAGVQGGIQVTLVDGEAEPFDITRSKPVDTEQPLEERQAGGLGLHLVRKMVDTLDYHYENGSSTIKFTKALDQQG